MLNNTIAIFLLLMKLLSPCYLSLINDTNNQHQVQKTNIHVNQSISSKNFNIDTTIMKWIKELKNVTKTLGETVILECQVESSYPVAFKWYRYNNLLDKTRYHVEESLFKSSVYVKNLKESQTGFYTCEASNGFEKKMSTGFIRIENPTIEPIDLNDDLLPSIDFQPEIIVNNEESIDKSKCELYTGGLCRKMISSQHISLSNRKQNEIEQNIIDYSKYLSEDCRKILLPMICLFVYPICEKSQMNIRTICRKSCYFFQNHTCMRDYTRQQKLYSNSQTLHHIPTCDTLPPTSDDFSCIKVEQSQNVSSSDISPIIQQILSSSYLIVIFLIIFTPLSCICFLILMFFCCCRRKQHIPNRLSSNSLSLKHSCQSTSSNTFHPTINNRNNRHNITLSSLSSTQTNSISINSHQTLLKADSKYPQVYNPTNDDSVCEISLSNIRFLEDIGLGEFGRIYIGELINSSAKCIIKTLQDENNHQYYLHEIEIFQHIRHVNVSCLIGICFEPQNKFSSIIYECLNNGNLHEYLILNRSKSIAFIDTLYILTQIASGMIYLSERKFIHKDLSAKNILISQHMDIKITNVACYYRKYHSDYYKIANHLLPVRWMAIESLLSGIYSEMSDVWSFGVLLWEIFSYGSQPYYGKTNPEVIEMVRDRKLLPCPMKCPKKIYRLMCSCWEEMSEQRPKFIELRIQLEQFDGKSSASSFDDNELISI